MPFLVLRSQTLCVLALAACAGLLLPIEARAAAPKKPVVALVAESPLANEFS